tara:strand:- start:445 stop:687 length:243 start_codon:yes stop_codon:yes gene_type:complete
MAIEINAYTQTKSERANGIKSDLRFNAFKTVNLVASVSIEPMLIIRNEIIANPRNSINEIITRITDIRMIKDVSFFDIME